MEDLSMSMAIGVGPPDPVLDMLVSLTIVVILESTEMLSIVCERRLLDDHNRDEKSKV